MGIETWPGINILIYFFIMICDFKDGARYEGMYDMGKKHGKG